MTGSIPRTHSRLALFFLIIAGAGIAAFVILLGIPTDEKNAVLLGFSPQRIALFALILLPSLLAVVLGLRALLHPAWADGKLEPYLDRLAGNRAVLLVSAAFFLLGWLSLFLPRYWFADFAAYFVRLRPMLVWLGFCGGLTFIIILIRRKGWHPGNILGAMRGQLKPVAITLLVLIGVWLLVALSGLGITPDPLFWNEAGAPLLGLQLIFCMLISLAVSRWLFLLDPEERKRWIDLAVIAAVWIGAFMLWQLTFMPRSPNAPGPYPPNNVYYPYMDADRYDSAAQYLLIGQGIANGDYMDKPLYVLLLALLHLVAGKNYPLLVELQVALLALAPVGLFLLSKELGSRKTGLLAALFAIFQQRNAIAATLEIQVSHSKLLLTEYPAALLLIFLCWLVVRWFKAPQRRPGLALVSGGLLGLAALVRPNALLLAPVLIAAILVRLRRPFRRGLAAAGLFMLVFIGTLLPWNLVIPKGYDSPYLIAKTKGLFETRILPVDGGSSLTAPETKAANGFKGEIKLNQPESTLKDSVHAQATSQPASYSYILRHYFHNEVMAFFILPHTLQLENLTHTLQAPYWQDIGSWDGRLPFGTILLIGLNLALVAVGIGTAWQRWRLAGLIPLIIHVSYYLANALVRNSGGRYLVPVDWVLLLYYAMGIVQVFRWLSGISRVEADFSREQIESRPLTLRRGILTAVIFLAVGGIIPLSRFAFPQEFAQKQPEQILAELQKVDWQDDRAGAWLDSLAAGQTLTKSGVAILYGRGLYPRFYEAGQAEPAGELGAVSVPPGDGPRLTLYVLAQNYPRYTVLQMPESPPEFPDGEAVAVIGCWYGNEKYIDAAAILVMTDPDVVYWRSAGADLTCPLSLP